MKQRKGESLADLATRLAAEAVILRDHHCHRLADQFERRAAELREQLATPPLAREVA